jgi:integrase
MASKSDIHPNDILSLKATVIDYETIQWPTSLLHRIREAVPVSFERDDFARRVLGMLAHESALIGVAHLPHANSELLLTSLLRSELQFSVWNNQHLEAFLPAGLLFVDRLSEILTECSADISELASTPTLRTNPVAYIQWKLAQLPSRHLIAPRIHRGLRRKVAQVQRTDSHSADIPALISRFVSYPVMIARNIPLESVHSHWSEYGDGEFDEIVHTTIERLADKRGVTPRTRITMQRDWEACVEGARLSGRYKTRISQSKPPDIQQQTENILESGKREIEDTPPSDILRQRFREKCVGDQERPTSAGKKSQMDSRRSILSRHYRLGIPVIDNNPTLYAPNVLPLVTAALIRFALITNAQSEDPNSHVSRAVIDLLWHTGQNATWVASLRLSWADTIPGYLPNPTYFPRLRRLAFLPKLHVGWPEEYESALRADERPLVSAIQQAHDEIYESTNAIHQIVIPRPLEDELLLALKSRPVRCGDDSPMFWWRTRDNSQPLNNSHIKTVLRYLSTFIKRHIPRHGNVHLADFRNTFDGWYASTGFCPEHRFLISDRAAAVNEVPLWYQTTPLRLLHTEYVASYTAVEQRLRTETEAVAARLGRPFEDAIMPRFTTSKELESMLEPLTGSVGSWRCARIDVVRQSITVLFDAITKTGEWDPDLPSDQAYHNAVTRLSVGLLLLLLGLRPFEIARIKTRHVDLPMEILTIDGKPHCDQKAARRLPLVTILVALIKHLWTTDHAAGLRPPSQHLLYLYTANGAAKPISAKIVEQVVTQAGSFADLPKTPDAYAWRHLFCRMLIELQIPPHIRRYCMGHEAQGIETFNAYSTHDLSSLRREYRRVAQCILHLHKLEALVDKWNDK